MNPPRRSPPSGSVGTADDDPTSLMEMQRDATEPILLDEDLVDSRPLIDDPEPERKPFGERFAEWRKHYLPLPDEVIEEYMGEDEYVVHTDHPSFRAFLIQNIILVIGVTIVGPIIVYLAQGGITWTTLLLFLALDVVLLYMAVKRLQDRYVSYVITNLRLIRLSGVFGRRLNSIPWTRMTGLGYFQSPLGRMLGYATLLIESANEESGLRNFSNINDPATFHQRILDMVSSKTGQSAGGKPPPPTKGVRKSIFQRRKERRELGGPNKAAAPWPKAEDPDPGTSDKPEATDAARTYEAGTSDEGKKPSGSKQQLRSPSKGQKGQKGQSKGRRLGGGATSGGLSGPGGPSGPGEQRRPGQPPPSARRRGPAPPGPTDPWGDPATPGPRGSRALPGQRPGQPGTAGRPSVADSTPRSQQLPRSGGGPTGDGRPSIIPDYGRNRSGGDPDAADVSGAPESGSAAFPQPQREGPPPLTPPRGTSRIRPGEPRTPPGGTDAVPSRGPAPTPPPPRPPQRRSTGRRPTPPAGTPAVRPGEPRDPRPPTDAAAETTDLRAEPPDLAPEPRQDPPPPTSTPTTPADRLAAPDPWPDPATGPAPETGPSTDPASRPTVRETDTGPHDSSDRGPHGRPGTSPDPGTGTDTDTEPGPSARAGDSTDASLRTPTDQDTGTAHDSGPGAPGRPDPEPGPSARASDSADASASTRTERDLDAGPHSGGRSASGGPRTSAERDVDGGPDAGAERDTEAGPGSEGRSSSGEPGGGGELGWTAGPGTGGSSGSEQGLSGRAGDGTDGGAPGDTGRHGDVEAGESGEAGSDAERGRDLRAGGSDVETPLRSDEREVPEFEPPVPRTPPSSRRMTPPGGTSAVRPGEPRTPPADGAGEPSATDAPQPPRAEPVVPPSLRRQTPPGGTAAVRPGEPRPPRPGESDEPREAAEGAGETGSDSDGEPRRQPWRFGRQRPGTGEPRARQRRLFSWFRREPLVDEDDGGDGDAHDALETLRPLGSARRRAQSFRRPRFRSRARSRRSLFPPHRELPPAATDDDPDTPDDRPS